MSADLTKYKDNPKTAYLYAEFVRIQNEEEETQALAKGDMAELAADDLKRLAEQKQGVLDEMERILKVEEKEEEFPNEMILEIRAGVGGQEAALFAEELAHM